MPADGAPGPRIAARTQALLAAAVGVVVALATSLVLGLPLTVLVGWIVAALVWLVAVWLDLRGKDAQQTAAWALREDPTRTTADLLLLAAAVVSLVAVGSVLVSANRHSGINQDLRVGLALLSVVVSWSVVHTVYALRYAALYYGGRAAGGVDFGEADAPDYADFAYLAITIGMTFQVSDTTLETKELRRTALRHALLAYVFGTGLLATAVNLAVSLSTR